MLVEHPLNKETEHTIEFNLIKVSTMGCPYQYAHFWKFEIERLVEDILEVGVITSIIFPYVSLEILARK